MKKLPVILLATILSVGATAQTLIPKVGGTFTNLALSDDASFFEDDSKFKFGFLIGVGYEIELTESLAIQPELLFIQKGNMYKDDDFKVTTNLNYLELPIMVKYKFSNFYLNAGPYVAYGLGGKLKAKEDGEPEVSLDVKFGEAPDFGNSDTWNYDNALDFGLQVGGGMVLIDKIVIDVRFGMGFGNLYDKPDGFDGDVKSQNRAIQLSVGYPISFK